MVSLPSRLPSPELYRKGSHPVRFSDNENWELWFLCSNTHEQSENIGGMDRKQDYFVAWLMTHRASLVLASGLSLPPCKTCQVYDLMGRCRCGGTVHTTAVLQWVMQQAFLGITASGCHSGWGLPGGVSRDSIRTGLGSQGPVLPPQVGNRGAARGNPSPRHWRVHSVETGLRSSWEVSHHNRRHF